MSGKLEKIVEEATSLSLEEKLILVSLLASQTSQQAAGGDSDLSWQDLRGTLPLGLTDGVDAQAWVKQQRMSSQAKRDGILGGRG